MLRHRVEDVGWGWWLAAGVAGIGHGICGAARGNDWWRHLALAQNPPVNIRIESLAPRSAIRERLNQRASFRRNEAALDPFINRHWADAEMGSHRCDTSGASDGFFYLGLS